MSVVRPFSVGRNWPSAKLAVFLVRLKSWGWGGVFPPFQCKSGQSYTRVRGSACLLSSAIFATRQAIRRTEVYRGFAHMMAEPQQEGRMLRLTLTSLMSSVCAAVCVILNPEDRDLETCFCASWVHIRKGGTEGKEPLG